MARHEDARCILLIGRGALGRGHAFDDYAFPGFGLPRYTAIAPDVEPAVVYSIARQESGFNAKAVSSAHALGLMQVTPDTGNYIAKRFNVAYDQSRLLNDTVYNMQIGAAALADDIGRNGAMYWHSPATMPAAPGSRNGSNVTAIPAIPRSIQSTGSNASRFPRPAITSSALSRAFRSIVRGLTTANAC
jgi:hypothetical protein